METTISAQGGSQMTTIVHELTHLAGTEDVVNPLCSNNSGNKCYGRENALKLGAEAPALSVENASNYEFQIGDWYHAK